MLRVLLLVLLLANLAFFVWSQGGFGATSGATAGDHEPERLARQVRPEAVQLLTPPVAASAPAAQASAASAAANPASAADAASAPSAPASDAASSPAAAEASASASIPASAASAGSAASVASASVAAAAAPAPPPPAPPGTRCLEAGPFSGTELATAETALAASAKTRRIARRWVPITPEAASAPAAPQHRLRIDATPDEVAVLESLPVSVLGRSFTPCTAR
jgi:hypothetical protein